MRIFSTIVVTVAVSATPVFAQVVCPEGKTFTGTCVKEELGATTRKTVLVNSQPKISYTAPPVLPGEDAAYAIPRDYNEIRRIYGVGGPTCTATGGGARPVVVTCQ